MYFADEPEHISLLRDTLRRFIEKEAPREKRREWQQHERVARKRSVEERKDKPIGERVGEQDEKSLVRRDERPHGSGKSRRRGEHGPGGLPCVV